MEVAIATDTATTDPVTDHVDWLLQWLCAAGGLPPELALRIVYHHGAVAHPLATMFRTDPTVRDAYRLFAVQEAANPAAEPKTRYGTRWHDCCCCATPMARGLPRRGSRAWVSHTYRMWGGRPTSMPHRNHWRNPTQCGDYTDTQFTTACSRITLLYRMWAGLHDVHVERFVLPIKVLHAFNSLWVHEAERPIWFAQKSSAFLCEFIADSTAHTEEDLRELPHERLVMHALGWEHFRVPAI